MAEKQSTSPCPECGAPCVPHQHADLSPGYRYQAEEEDAPHIPLEKLAMVQCAACASQGVRHRPCIHVTRVYEQGKSAGRIEEASGEELRFERQERELREAPTTWLPALLIALIQAAEKKKCFKEGGAVVLVQNTITKMKKPR